ncbi:carbohydrate porin [Vibrio mangrovi]|uniref:Carbohydrate porin n=1 Tax=Vibrio mangrovi TaxID=474394 RepID=A0A1Y6INB2_9VIBR|nr:carbohydrate porin [Vibrio mangrovi]MDW6004074.1 carbohydrate porin [Vibrio mangrovi]SMR99128.1 hypothetical protein VIM7927_00350 [Vibrio mangrovi]
MKASGILKLSAVALLTSAALNVNAGTSITNDMGTFAISGDVEFDTNYRNEEVSGPDTTTYDQTGRLLIGVSGMRDVGSNGYISANAQTLLHLDGDITADDAWIAIGEKADWEIKLGRFEAYDLFPAGQDTVVNYAQDVYMTKYARGRSDNGQINLSKTTERVYFELSTNFMENNDDNIGARNNAVFLRPVVAVTLTDSLKLSAGAEVNATADSEDAANDFAGYGATLNYATGDFNMNVSYATRDFDTTVQEDTTYGINAQYKNFFIAYVYGETDTGTTSEVKTVYSSYKFANIMDVEDLALYVGAYYSDVKDSDNTDSGARLRVKYLF